MAYPHKWSPISYRSSAGQRKFAAERWTLYHCATQLTIYCILVTRVCVCVSVCLSLAAFPHYCTDSDVTWGNGSGTRHLVVHCWAALICNRSTGFVAICQHSAEREMSAGVCTRSMPGFYFVGVNLTKFWPVIAYDVNKNKKQWNSAYLRQGTSC